MNHLIALCVIIILSLSPFWGMYLFWLLDGLPKDAHEGNKWYVALPWAVFYTIPLGLVAAIGYLVYAVFMA